MPRLLLASKPACPLAGRRHQPGPAVLLLAAAGLGVFLWGAYIPVKAWAAQILLDQAWHKAAAGERDARPWPWADTRPVARITLARLNRSNIVLSGAQGRTLAFGPGHVDGTALPGDRGHSVLSAHRDTHFKWLQEAEIGDLIETERPDGTRGPYRIVDKKVIDSRTEQVMLHPDRDLLTLITCYPFENWDPGGPERMIVTAEARF